MPTQFLTVDEEGNRDLIDEVTGELAYRVWGGWLNVFRIHDDKWQYLDIAEEPVCDGESWVDAWSDVAEQ